VLAKVKTAGIHPSTNVSQLQNGIFTQIVFFQVTPERHKDLMAVFLFSADGSSVLLRHEVKVFHWQRRS